MKIPVEQRIRELRRVMSSRGVDALIVPSTDPHQSEYVGPRWQARQWLSGFTGSAGTLVVTALQAGLWTDDRYHIQAEQELKGSGIKLYKLREPGVPGFLEWIAETLKSGQTVAFDGRVVSLNTIREMKKVFAAKTLKSRGREDWVDLVWRERPAPPSAPAFDYPVKYAGLNRARKLETVRARLKEKKADALLLASLDDIAWLFNIRGGDIDHSPVVLAYALVEADKATLYSNPAKFSPSLKRDLQRAGVTIHPYDSITAHLKSIASHKSLCLNPRRINQWLADAIPRSVKVIEDNTDITTELKAVKNRVEQENFRRAALMDGLALVKFFAWLEHALKTGNRISEYDAGVRLAEFRKESPDYRGDSFPTICAFGANAALMHYSAKADTAAALKRKGLLFVDSGGNYLQGTMDTTRTVALGRVSLEARRSYTWVLKGMMALSRTQFPVGATGTHLDVLVRAPLWAHGVNYRHGSGHGVGSYLNVHEGPQGLLPTWNSHAFKPGMILTIEPGVYVRGEYGIRTENMVLVTQASSTVHGNFLKFETLTVCPIDVAPLIPSLLTPDEKAWLNEYHRSVWRKLSPLLKGSDRDWLKRKTDPI